MSVLAALILSWCPDGGSTALVLVGVLVGVGTALVLGRGSGGCSHCIRRCPDRVG